VTAPLSWKKAALVIPYAYALALPLLPLLIELADVLPRGVAVVGRNFAVWLAIAAATAGFIGIAGAARTWGWREFVRAPLFWALAALVVTETIAAATGISWRAGVFEIACQVGVGIACIVFWLALSDARARRAFLALFMISGIAACAFAIGLTLSRHPPAAFAYEHGRAAGTFLQPNEFAGYLLFLIPMGIAQWAAPPLLRRLGVGAAGIATVALAMSASRAAILGLLLAMPILVRRFGRRALVGYAIAAAVVLTIGLTGMRNVAHDPSENASRIAVWRGAARMAERFALVGVGPVAFNIAYPLYKMPDAQVDEVHAHDLPLNVLIENGALGFFAFAFAVVACIRAGRASGLRIPSQDAERGLLFAGLSTAFAASAVQNSVDLVTTFVFLMWWPMMGLMIGMSRDGSPAS
jgi:O-antigen ligase